MDKVDKLKLTEANDFKDEVVELIKLLRTDQHGHVHRMAELWAEKHDVILDDSKSN
jgi:hypothetical protein